MSTEDRKNPNYRPRDAKGHYVKSGKPAAGMKAKSSKRHGKPKAEAGKKPQKAKPAKARAGSPILEIISGIFWPGTRYVEIVETEIAHSESQLDTAPVNSTTAHERRLDSLLKDNESLRSDLGELTTKLLDEKQRSRTLAQRVESAERLAECLRDRASTHRIALIAFSAISFIAGCLIAATIACR